MSDEEPPAETPAKKTPAKTPAEKAPAKKTPARKTPAKKAPAKKAPAKKVAAEMTPVKRSPAKKTAAEKTAAEKTAAEKTPPRETAAEKTPVKAPATKTAATKTAATKTAAEKAPATRTALEEGATDPGVPAHEDPSEVEAVSVAAPPTAEQAVRDDVTPPTEQNPPVDQTPAAPRRRRPLLALVLVTVVVIAAVLAVRLGGDDHAASDQTGQGDGTGGGAAPTPPASAPGQGSYVESTVAADGSVSVRQWIRSSTQIRTLDVAVVDPVSSSDAQAVDVVVEALDGSVLAKRASVGAQKVRLTLSTSVPNLYLSYQVTGAADDASQSVAGRLLVTVLGMDVSYSGSNGGVQRMVTGPGTVTNVACLRVTAAASAAPKPCGSPTNGGGWLVDLRGIDRSDRLLAQLESTS